MATTLSTCRWNWCTRSFPDHNGLVAHVEEDHIAKADPVKRKDVSLLQRVEDGASLEESVPRTVWAPVSDDSQSQSATTSRHVERAVMTDPVSPVVNATMLTALVPPPQDQSPRRGSSFRSGASTPAPSPRPPAKENVLPMKFSEMRGTPSPAPSLVPASPSIGAMIHRIKQNTTFPVSPRRSPHATPSSAPSLVPASPSAGTINRMKQTTVFPVSPRRSPHTTPRPHRTPQHKSSPKPGPSRETPRPRGLLPSPSFLAPVGHEDADGDSAGAAGAVDPDTSQEIVESQLLSLDDAGEFNGMDVDPVTPNGLQSQWQPQSQLPLPGSFESSSFPMSTIDPNQLHAPLAYAPDQQRVSRERGSEGGISRGSSPLKTPTSPRHASQLHTPLSYVPDQRVFREGGSGNGISIGSSPSKILTSPAAGTSRSQGTPRSLSSAPHPPSPSTLDLSYITNTDSPQSARRAPSHHRASPRATQSPSTSKTPFAQGVSGLGHPASESQGSDRSDMHGNELPFDNGFGYGYGDGYGETQPLQTQVPLKQSSYDSSWSQG